MGRMSGIEVIPSSSMPPGDSVILRFLRVLHGTKLSSRRHKGSAWISVQLIRDRVLRFGGQAMDSGHSGRYPENSSTFRPRGQDVFSPTGISMMSLLGRRRDLRFRNRLTALLIGAASICDLTRNRFRFRSLEHFERGRRDASLVLISVPQDLEGSVSNEIRGRELTAYENENMGAVNSSRFFLTLPNNLAVTLLLLWCTRPPISSL